MALDEKVTDVIYSVVAQNNQPEKVAKKIIQWLNDLSESPNTLDNKDEVDTHLNNILDAVSEKEAMEQGELL